MKYVVTWTARTNGMTEEEAARSLAVFSKWSPDPSVTFHQFVARADGRGGYAVVETDNVGAVLRDATLFGVWFDFEVQPVLDLFEAAPIQQQVVDLLASIS